MGVKACMLQHATELLQRSLQCHVQRRRVIESQPQQLRWQQLSGASRIGLQHTQQRSQLATGTQIMLLVAALLELLQPLPGEDAVIDDIGHGIGQLQVAAHINR